MHITYVIRRIAVAVCSPKILDGIRTRVFCSWHGCDVLCAMPPRQTFSMLAQLAPAWGQSYDHYVSSAKERRFSLKQMLLSIFCKFLKSCLDSRVTRWFCEKNRPKCSPTFKSFTYKYVYVKQLSKMWATFVNIQIKVYYIVPKCRKFAQSGH
jgi:hypothetical protein